MESNSTQWEGLNIVASTLMTLNGIFGAILNISVLYVFICEPSQKTSFNLMCAYRSMGNTVILIWGFLATFVPITLKATSPFSNIYETIVIISCNNIYVFVQFSGMLIAFNRFFAMFFPMTYAKLFNMKITFAVLVIHCLWKTSDNVYYLYTFLPLECFTLYSPVSLNWIPNMEKRCHYNGGMPNPFSNLAVVLAALVIMNVATFSKIYFFYKSTETEAVEMKRKARKNRMLFSQTVFQDGIMLIDMLFTFKLSGLSNERFWTFTCGTLVWQSVHSVDGFIMVMFNERLSFLKRKLFGLRLWCLWKSVKENVAVYSSDRQLVHQLRNLTVGKRGHPGRLIRSIRREVCATCSTLPASICCNLYSTTCMKPAG